MKLILAVLLLSLGGASARAAELTGRVTTKAGAPLAGVLVFGQCRGFAETDREGRYKLRAPSMKDCGDLVFFTHAGHRPALMRVAPTDAELNVTLEEPPDSEWLRLRQCPGGRDSVRRVGFFLRLPVPRGAKLKEGRDIDYTFYIVRLGEKEKGVFVHGISGPQATYGFPSDRLVLDAQEYTLRPWKFGDAEGVDVRGRAQDGTRWRYFGTYGEAVTYEGQGAEDAAALDAVIDGVCYRPFKK